MHTNSNRKRSQFGISVTGYNWKIFLTNVFNLFSNAFKLKYFPEMFHSIQFLCTEVWIKSTHKASTLINNGSKLLLKSKTIEKKILKNVFTAFLFVAYFNSYNISIIWVVWYMLRLWSFRKRWLLAFVQKLGFHKQKIVTPQTTASFIIKSDVSCIFLLKSIFCREWKKHHRNA